MDLNLSKMIYFKEIMKKNYKIYNFYTNFIIEFMEEENFLCSIRG
jgi:hypothetical protein